MGIQFISGIILARLLTPFDYGCIGMLSIFMVIADTFIDSGFGSSLIQKSNPSDNDYSTIFFWNLFMAVLMYFILFYAAPPISRFYNIPLLSSVLRVNGIVLIINAFSIIQKNLLEKHLNFRRIAKANILASVIALCVTVYMAYKGAGVWSLVTQNIIIALIPCISFWVTSKWRPSFVFSTDSFKQLFGFGFYMFLTHLINNVSGQVQGLLIGRFYNPSTMGYYSKAHDTERLASTSISGVMTSVTFPLYSQIQNDKERMAYLVKRMTSTLAYLTFPLMFILLLLAKPIFVLLYSDRWIQSVPYFQVLCIAGLAVCMQSVNLQTIPAIGKSNIMLFSTIVKRTVGLLFIIGGLLLFGMKGLLVGMVINSWFSYFVNAWLVSRYIGYNWKEQIMDILPILLASSGTALTTYLIGMLLPLGMYFNAIIMLVIYACIYFVWSVLFKPASYIYTRTVLTEFIMRKIHKSF